MKWDNIKKRLEDVLNTSFDFDVLDTYPELGDEERSWIEKESLYFPLEKHNYGLSVLKVNRSDITTHERELIELTIQVSKANTELPEFDKPNAFGRHSYIQNLRHWLMEQLKSGTKNTVIPEPLHAHMNLYAAKIPLLLYGEANDSEPLRYEEFKKLMDSFFETDLLIIPLAKNEWLILASESVVKESLDDSRNGEQSDVEEALESIALGLHEMLVNEWIGDCHLAIDIPMVPAHELLSTIHNLRQMITLGRQYHMESHLHLPWKLKLERLLHSVSDEKKTHFAQEVLRQLDYRLDLETLQTLEQFFELNCNVSETARMLYIHRNTLLYRLDKFKQETGLDVRSFNDAVLVYVALLLYKVTKRK